MSSSSSSVSSVRSTSVPSTSVPSSGASTTVTLSVPSSGASTTVTLMDKTRSPIGRPSKCMSIGWLIGLVGSIALVVIGSLALSGVLPITAWIAVPMLVLGSLTIPLTILGTVWSVCRTSGKIAQQSSSIAGE